MGAMQRRKGGRGEREIADLIAGLTGWPVRRKVRQHAGDSDLTGIPSWCPEAKRRKTATSGEVRAWWQQTVEQAEAASKLPVLFYRPDRGEWRAVEWTATTTVEAWAAVAREFIERPT